MVHTVRMRWMGIALFVGLLACGEARAGNEIPAESFAKLQTVFTVLRDDLATKNDDYWHTGEHNRCIATMRLMTQIDPHETDAYQNAAWLM